MDIDKDVVAPIVAAEVPAAIMTAKRALLRNATDSQLLQLGRNAHPAVALHAEWARTIRAMKLKPTRKTEKMPCWLAQRFLGFVEGRLRIRTPEWWQETLLSALVSTSGEMVSYEVPDWLHAYRRTGVELGGSGLQLETESGEVTTKDGWELLAPPDTKLRREGTTLVATVHGRTVTVPIDVVQDAGGADRLYFVPDGQRCYLAVHSGGFEFSMVCIDQSSHALLWKTKVWSAHCQSLRGLVGERLSLIIADDQVVVLGAESCAMFIEAFDKNTGKNRFRFSTWYDEGA
jgi:hypothetical protein